MKKITLLSLLILPLATLAQKAKDADKKKKGESAASVKKVKDVDETKIGAPNDRISFIVGPGASIITRKLYNDPVINQTNNMVMIDNATWLKANLAVGIIYTPYIYNVSRLVPFIDAAGQAKIRREIEIVPKGFTYAAFINPLAFNKVTETQSFLSMVDFGVGLGYRYAGGLVIMGTAEFFSVRQPRQWFIDEYKDAGKTYSIGGAAQKSIDINDNSIFTSKPVITVGFKICYSFDVIKNYVTGSQTLVTAQPAEKPAVPPAEKPAAPPVEEPAAPPVEEPATPPAEKPARNGH